jgi:DME family drug/metabolite transporter
MIGELAAIGAALSWTISAMLYRRALQQTKPVSANIVRLSSTSVVLLVFLVAMITLGVTTSLRPDIIALAAASGIIGLGLGDTLYMVSLERIGVARAVPITCTYPLFNLLWAVFLIGEPITLPLLSGVVIIFVGVWLLSHENLSSKGENRKSSSVTGIAAALVTAILWSISIAMMDIAVKNAAATPSLEDAFVINTVRTVTVAALLLALSPIIDRQHIFLKMKKRTAATLVIGGIVALAIGWFFLGYSFLEIPESQAVPISSTTPLFSTLVGVFLLHEKVTARNMLGSIIVVAGIFLVFFIK